MHQFVSLFAVYSVLRALLLSIAWLTAICSKSPARRKVALQLVSLMLAPVWRRR